MLRNLRTQARFTSEEGSIVVVAAIVIILFAVLGTAIVQIGDWLEHRRSAQARVDAAALAGGQLFGQCFEPNLQPEQASANIEAMAKHYMGFASSVPGAPLNTQFGAGTGDFRFNNKTYPDGSQSDDTPAGLECQNMILDVKLQDTAIPSIMGWIPSATIHAHARVQAQAITQFKGAFPLAIPDVNPKFVYVTFVNESNNGAELTGCGGTTTNGKCTYALTKGAPVNSQNPWTVSASPNLPAAAVSQGTAGGVRIGVRVGMGAVPGTCANTGGNANWSCFDGNSNSLGAEFIRDYSAAAASAVQPNAPVLRQVIPSNSCSGALPAQFGASPFVSDANGVTTCSVGVSARVDFGTGANNPTNAKTANGVKATLQATINGATITLAPQAGSYDAGTGTWLWVPSAGNANLTIDANGGNASFPVTLNWAEQDGTQGGNTCSTAGNNKCKGTFESSSNGSTVMRFTSATDAADGAIKLMAITQNGASAYSLTPGIRNVSVEVRLQGNLAIVNPPVEQLLRTTGGSRTTAVECDGPGNSRLDHAIINGCDTPYQINNSQICPDPAPPAGPDDCVPNKTGNLGTTFPRALDTRFAGCPTNNWPDTTKPGDPRVIVMFLTDFSALGGSGHTDYPVVDFAAFYVMGWSGNSCGDAWPFAGQAGGGDLWGYFIKTVSLNQTPSGQACDPTKPSPCVPVLVR